MMNRNAIKERTNAIARIVVTAVLLINAGLTAAGKSPIPLDENTVYEVISQVAAGAAVLISWWKNNNLTQNAVKAQTFKDKLSELK